MREVEKSLRDHVLLLSALNQEEVRQRVGRRSDTVCWMQAKRAMFERQHRSRPGRGICGKNLGTTAGTDFDALRGTPERQRMRHRGGQCAEQCQQHRQPRRPEAVQRWWMLA